VTSWLGNGNVIYIIIIIIVFVKARPLKPATHENVKCTDDLSYVFLKFSFGAERQEQNHSPELPLLLHSWHFSSPLIFILLKVVSLER
jgi:hypothetical protein